MEDKSYVKISKQDYDIAKSFFQNDKHLDEFISNVSRYYWGKNICFLLFVFIYLLKQNNYI